MVYVDLMSMTPSLQLFNTCAGGCNCLKITLGCSLIQGSPLWQILPPEQQRSPTHSRSAPWRGTYINRARGASGAPGNDHSRPPLQVTHPCTSPHWPEGKRMSKPRGSCTPPLFSHHRRGGKQGSECRVSACRWVRDTRCNGQILHPGSRHLEARLEFTASVLFRCTAARTRRWQSGNPS